MRTIWLADECICCDSKHLLSAPAILMPFVAKRVFGHDPIDITSEWGMRDLKSGTSYYPSRSLYCQDCGTLFLDYRFDTKQMGDLYRDYRDRVYTEQRVFYEPGYASGIAKEFVKRHAYVETVELWLTSKIGKTPAVLDWGGGNGLNTPFLGRTFVGVYEISGVMPVEGAHCVTKDEIPNHKYDLVTCMQVLEHVSFPEKTLLEIIQMMTARMWLYVEVPFEAIVRDATLSDELVHRKRFWHEHNNFYTEAGLRRLCQRVGLDVVDVLYQSFDNGVRRGENLGLLTRLKSHSR